MFQLVDPRAIRFARAFLALRQPEKIHPAPPPQRVYQREVPEPYDFMSPPAPKRPRRPSARPQGHRLKDQPQDQVRGQAHVWLLSDAETGQALGRVWGDKLWALSEACQLASSHGYGLEAVDLKPAPAGS
jgi:hypothetical protein